MMSPSATIIAEGEDGPEKPTIRACDLCRQKKIRCKWTAEGCIQCLKYKTHCNFTPIKTKKSPRRPPGHKHVEELEKRLQRMEAFWQSRGSSIYEIDGNSKERHRNGSKNLSSKNKASYLLANPSALPIAQGQIWGQINGAPIGSKLDSTSSTEPFCIPFQGVHASVEYDGQISAPRWKLRAAPDAPTRRTFKQLPPKHEALLLIQEMFRNFNTAYPVFDQASFLSTFEARYPGDERDDPGWWACLNVVFALAHRFRAMGKPNSHSEDQHAWGYLQNALAVVTELTMLHSELFAVQAIVGMAIVVQGTPNPRPCSVLISAALRLAQNMGLHRREQKPGLDAAEIEQRKRVFWIAYFLDKDVSLRTRQPPAQDDDDMDVDLPSETTELDLVGGNIVNFLNIRIGLAIIQGQIYKRLCSIKALKQSERERLVTAKELDRILHAWKWSVPIDFVGGNVNTALGTSSFPTLLHITIIRFTYFNALEIIHRSLNPGSHLHIESTGTIARLQPPGVSLVDNIICVEEARRSIQLFQVIPHGDYAYIWLILQICVSASTTILSHVISNSADPFAIENLKLVQPVLKLLKELGKRTVDLDVEGMEECLQALWKQATAAVGDVRGHGREDATSEDKVSSENRSFRAERESVEDFISRIERISADLTVDSDVISIGQSRIG